MLVLRLKGIRLRVDKGLGRICSVCSALGLEPAFRRGLGLGVGFKVQVKVNQNRSTCYVIGNTACEGLACEPWPTIQWQLQRPPFPHTPAPPPPPPPLPDHTMGGGGAGNARRLTIYVCLYAYVFVFMCECMHVYSNGCMHVCSSVYLHVCVCVCCNLDMHRRIPESCPRCCKASKRAWALNTSARPALGVLDSNSRRVSHGTGVSAAGSQVDTFISRYQ